MRRMAVALACCLLLVLDARAALSVTTKDLNSTTPQQLAQMLAGTGITVTNVTFTGAKVAGGSFTGGLADGLGIDVGVILSSGDVANAVGPNNDPGVTTANDTPGDANLDAIVGAGHATFDAAVLEFDFVPTAGTVSFRYVFASDEYLEFVNLFNDVFAFYVDKVNVALIPGTTTPVAINTVNLDLNSLYYVNNDFNPQVSLSPFGTQFDGFTKVLTATVTVTPNVSHHIKLVIADTDDTILDSAVFLEASSFTSGTCTIPAPPSNVLIQPTGNPDGPVTGIDFLDLSWTAPTPAPSFYYFAINGDEAQTTEATSVPNQPPRGSNDPILLKVRAACSITEFSDTAEFEVSPSPPTASFSVPPTATVNTPVTFTDASDPNATSWLWIFGDGDIARAQSVVHSYAAPGDYTCWLIASNGAGADVESKVITVTAAAPVLAQVPMQTRAFDASNRERQRLEGVNLAGSADRWLNVRSHEKSREAILFLRFLDPSGALVRERRLSVAPGQDAAFNLKAYRLEGNYDLELVSTQRVTASVTEPRKRETREVRREER